MKNALVVCLIAGLVLSLGALAVAADDAAKEIKGEAGCAKCSFKGEDCGAAVKVGEHVFAMKAGDKASDQTKKMIDSFKGAKEVCEVVITGTVKDKAIIVDDIKKIEKKKAE
jgi:hypothetical protein